MHLKGKKIDLFSINITMTNDSNTKKKEVILPLIIIVS